MNRNFLVKLIVLFAIGVFSGYFLGKYMSNIDKTWYNKVVRLLPLENRASSNEVLINITPRQLWNLQKDVIENQKLPPRAKTHKSINNSSKTCKYSFERDSYFQSFKFWIKLAAKLDIQWFIEAGTLLGSRRYRDAIPWDGDGDIGIFSKDEDKIRKLATKRGTILNNDEIHIVVRPRHFTSTYRLDCNGKNVTDQIDSCSFTGPLARIYTRKPYSRIDLFLHHIGPQSSSSSGQDGTRLVAYSEFHAEAYPIQLIFPLHTCKYMGLVMFCPASVDKFLLQFYGKNIIDYEDRACIDGRWLKKMPRNARENAPTKKAAAPIRTTKSPVPPPEIWQKRRRPRKFTLKKQSNHGKAPLNKAN